MARRVLRIEEEFGAHYIYSHDGLCVQSASLEGALRKAAQELDVAHADGSLEIRSTQDMVEVLDTLMGRRQTEVGGGRS